MFELPEEVKRGIKDYSGALESFISGAMSADRFKGIRVPWGIYSHRKGVDNNIYMVRVRIPGGAVDPAQLSALAEVSGKYGTGNLHLTTRQDIQIHGVRIKDTGRIMEDLLICGLSPRGGGGNTVRNVIACEFAGVCGEECFNVLPVSDGLSMKLLKEDSSYTMPRKYKIAFSGCPGDCAGVRFNDLGFMAVKKNGIPGFRVWAGGGMGANCALGSLLEEFVTPEDVFKTAKAVKEVFYKHGNRKNKHRARLRFLIANLGWDEFTALYKKEKKKLTSRAKRELRFRRRRKREIFLKCASRRAT